MMGEQIVVKAAGEIQIDEVVLIVLVPGLVEEIDISKVFAEINLFEDMFSDAMYGNILIGDSNNLLNQLSIQGLEGLRINVRTPGLSDKQRIYKTFGIYAITDQQVLSNNRYQSYRLHFASLELLSDALSKPINRPIPAKADGIGNTQDQLIPFVYSSFLVKAGPTLPGSPATFIARNIGVANGKIGKSKSPTDLVMGAANYDYTTMKLSNGTYIDKEGSYIGSAKMQFIAPNWSALKTINWITDRSVPPNQIAAGSFVFYESNKAFHFTSVDALIQLGKTETAPIFKYQYSPGNLLAASDNNNADYGLDIIDEYGRVLKFEFGSVLNLLDETNMSYFGNEIRAIDPVLKRYRELNYSFTEAYSQLQHTTIKPATPMIPKAPDFMLGNQKTTIDTRRNIIVRHRQPYFLFDNDPQTPNINPAVWVSQRAARMASLSIFNFQILVNGRTDMKVGNMVTFTYPSLRGDITDPNTFDDKFYSGYFLVTAIRHFISPIKHQMTMELIKDGLETLADNTTSTDPTGLDYEPGP